MFKVGARYEFKMREGGGEVTFWGTIETYDHPMIKLQDHEIPEMYMPGTPPAFDANKPASPKTVIKGKIINVTSPNFISAEEEEGR